eukprot:g31171.t1
MAANDPINIDAGGMIDEDKVHPIIVVGGKRVVRAEVREMGWIQLWALSTTALGIIRVDATEMEELGEWKSRYVVPTAQSL